MIRLQILTGCRPHEACAIRACDIEMAGPDRRRTTPNTTKSIARSPLGRGPGDHQTALPAFSNMERRPAVLDDGPRARDKEQSMLDLHRSDACRPR
jgi:integrase